jgi:hypothetical protein
MILDGRRRFGCSLPAFYARHDIVQQAANHGVLVPPVGLPDPDHPLGELGPLGLPLPVLPGRLGLRLA